VLKISLSFSSLHDLLKWGVGCGVVIVLLHSVASGAQAACAEDLEGTRRAVAYTLYGLRTTKEAVREAEAKTHGRVAVMQELRLHPPEDYDSTLARQVGKLRRSIVRPKRALLAQLREQHEDARRHWERGMRLIHEQFLEAQEAFQEQLLTPDVYCYARESYLRALSLYRNGLEHYRTGLALYADGLNAYRERFVVPCVQGYTKPYQWQALVERLEREDFLQEFLSPLRTNALRNAPRDIPPDVDTLVRERP